MLGMNPVWGAPPVHGESWSRLPPPHPPAKLLPEPPVLRSVLEGVLPRFPSLDVGGGVSDQKELLGLTLTPMTQDKLNRFLLSGAMASTCNSWG